MLHIGQDSLKTKESLQVDDKTYHYFSLKKLEQSHGSDIQRLPYTLKILLENLLRFEDGKTVTTHDIKALETWLKTQTSQHEIAYRPSRVLMQDFTGVPSIVDLAAMRTALEKMGVDPQKISPLSPVDLVIDHSVMVDSFANQNALATNASIEMQRNIERYEFLRWGQKAFDNFRVVPPGTGICHQVNLEYLGQTVWHAQIGHETYAYPDTLVGTDSHTTMINALGILGCVPGFFE